MKIHGLNLDQSPLIAQDKSLSYAENIAIGEGNQSYINEDGFIEKLNINQYLNDNVFPNISTDISNSRKLDIIGTIPTNIGVVLFCVSKTIEQEIYQHDLYFIIYITINSNIPSIEKIIYDIQSDDINNTLNFSIDRPIHGDYIYNYKNDLIITFTEGIEEEANETRLINLNNDIGYHEESEKLYKIDDVSILKLIPDVEYPTLNIEVQEGGNLRTGAYQIAIAYKLFDDTYTNYSILSVPVIVSGKYGEDYAPNSEINRQIIVTFNKPNVSFNSYKLAIVHIIDTSQLVYETEDIDLIDDNNYTISRLDNYSSIILDDVFIKNIAYIKEQTLINYNNRLIRGNVQTLNYHDLDSTLSDFTKNNINISVKPLSAEQVITDNNRYFKYGEEYVIYAGYFDTKGDLINIYHIPNGDLDYFKLDNVLNLNHNRTYPSNQYIHSISNQRVISGIIPINVMEKPYLVYSAIVNYNNQNIGVPIIRISGDKNDFSINNRHHIILTSNIRLNNNTRAYLYAKFSNQDEFEVKSEITGNLYPFNDSEYLYSFDLSYTVNDSINDILYYIIIDSMCDANTQPLVCSYTCTSNMSFTGYIESPCTILATINNPSILPKTIKSIAYFYIEHNTYNSRILSQALCIPDTETVNFASNQSYKGQFNGKHALRFYPFEYLYNKISKLKVKVNWKYNLGELDGITENGDDQSKAKIIFIKSPFSGNLDGTYAVFSTGSANDSEEDNGNTLTKYVHTHGVKILDCDITNLESINDENLTDSVLLEYISSDNTSQQNIAGDSYYRTKDLTINDYPKNEESTFPYNPCIADLLNPSENLYPNLDNQKLQIASSIKSINDTSDTELIGDTYLSYLTLRITTPAPSFRYGDAEHHELDSNSTVFRWVLTFPIESKYNITARYSDNIVDKPYFLHGASLQKYVELIGTSYKVDNYINTDVGKGYNPIYNENGIENFIYYKTIPGTNNHPHRIIRSLFQNAESTSINWRIFKTDDYKDMPFNRGQIISLKTDNKNLYIQQQYGLHLLQERDQLNSDDANQSYLGTSDLFNMEPKEIMYSPSGYIGCESYFDTHINTVGYVVIDSVHKKIFMLNGTKLNEISNLKTREYFKRFIEDDLKNPYIKRGRIINYNEDKNILYITQLSDTSKTMSFSPINNAWLSFHTYIPDFGFVNRNGLYWGKNGVLYQPQSYIKGKYFDNTFNDSIIQFILNENTIYNKLLKTIVWKDQVSHRDNDYIQYFFKETINNLMVHNFDQCSGKLDVAFNDNPKKWWDGDTGVNKINLWRFNKLFDLVKNPDDSIVTNNIIPNTNNLKIDYKWYSINRFICQFIYLTLWYNNEDNKSWELIDVNPEWQIDNRNDQNYGNQNNNRE